MRYSFTRCLAVIAVIGLGMLSICDADDSGSGQSTVIPLKVVKGTDREPTSRIFTVPVQCGDVSADFTWGCYGFTQISESFAKRIGANIVPATDLGDGYAGRANINIHFGGQDYNVDAQVMKDADCQDSEKNGVIGLDIAKRRQWTLDPEAQTLTLRDLNSVPTTYLAELPLGDAGAGISITITIRNESADVGLMPSSMYIQAAPDLQRKWDLGGIVTNVKDAPKVYGHVQIMTIEGRDNLKVAPNIVETEIPIALVGDPKHPEDTPFAQSGLGQCLLNRWVYTVDQEAGKFWIIRRVSYGKNKATTEPSDQTEQN